MKQFLLGSTLLACLALAAAGCGGDDDDGGAGSGGSAGAAGGAAGAAGGTASGGCEHAKMVCASNPDVEIDCGADWDSAPAMIKDCAGKAATCDAVGACLVGGG